MAVDRELLPDKRCKMRIEIDFSEVLLLLQQFTGKGLILSPQSERMGFRCHYLTFLKMYMLTCWS